MKVLVCFRTGGSEELTNVIEVNMDACGDTIITLEDGSTRVFLRSSVVLVKTTK